MKKLMLSLMMIFSLSSADAAKLEDHKKPMFDFDKSHTSIMFFIWHVGFSRVIGEFNDYDGYFMFDKNKPEESYVTITINPGSVDVGHAELNKELAGEKFFDVEHKGNIKFESTKVEVTGENTGKITGNLTLYGVTKPITLDARFNKQAEFFGKTKAGFSLSGKIKRTDFGFDWGVPDMLSDEVELLIESEGIMRDIK